MGSKPIEVEVRGTKVSVDPVKLKSWRAFKMVAALQSPDATEFEKIGTAMAFVSLVAGMDEESIVEAVGGEDAPAEDVVAFVTEVISGCYPKN